jgi:hypothetical protein
MLSSSWQIHVSEGSKRGSVHRHSNPWRVSQMEGQAAYDSHLSRGCESSVVASVRSLSWPRTVLDSRAGPLIWSRLTKVFGSCEEAMCSHSVEFQSGCTHIHTYTYTHTPKGPKKLSVAYLRIYELRRKRLARMKCTLNLMHAPQSNTSRDVVGK